MSKLIDLTSNEVIVEIHEDHLQSLIAASPVKAFEELLYNALDADATYIKISFIKSDLGAIHKVVIEDNGTGIHYNNQIYFKNVGGSWKKDKLKTETKNRILHGKLGKGRFKAFSIGGFVTWETVYQDENRKMTWKIEGNIERIRKFYTNLPQVTTNELGTKVTIENVSCKDSNLLKLSLYEELTAIFALYLKNYPDIVIVIDDKKLEPQKHIVHSSTYFDEIPDQEAMIKLETEVIEWNIDVNKEVYLCDKNGFALIKKEYRTNTAKHNLTAYVKSDYIAQKYSEGNLFDGALDTVFKKILEAAKSNISSYHRQKILSEGGDIISSWKNEQVYPYEGEPTSTIENVERQVFNIVALNVNEHISTFEELDNTSKKFSFSLLREALNNNPTSLKNILENVIKLPKDKIEELNNLLNYTTLSDLIAASKVIADRINFITSLEALIYDHKNHLKERTHLHKILEQHTWIFGEEYNLGVSDQSLDQVLNKHLTDLRQQKKQKVKDSDGRSGIVDLMLSKKIKETNPEQLNHLIIELKRPTQKIDINVLNQISRYADAVMNDERFMQVPAKWSFWAISNELDDNVKMQARQKDRPEGLVLEGENCKIWLFPWSKIINDCKARLMFYKEELNFNTDAEKSLEYLKKLLPQHLPESVKH